MFGNLYIVSTPIGNIKDISARGKEVLLGADVVLAEDTRVSGKLLKLLEVKVKKLSSYHAHSGELKKLEILKCLTEGKNVALMSDAGTPGISDPGNELIDYILEKEPMIKVHPVPGPSALSAALSVCGFDVTRFVFASFLPKKRRRKLFTRVKKSGFAFVFFDSPRRLCATLEELCGYFGNERRVFVGRELTKVHETHYRGTLSDVAENLNEKKVKGEVVVVVEKEKKKALRCVAGKNRTSISGLGNPRSIR